MSRRSGFVAAGCGRSNAIGLWPSRKAAPSASASSSASAAVRLPPRKIRGARRYRGAVRRRYGCGGPTCFKYPIGLYAAGFKQSQRPRPSPVRPTGSSARTTGASCSTIWPGIPWRATRFRGRGRPKASLRDLGPWQERRRAGDLLLRWRTYADLCAARLFEVGQDRPEPGAAACCRHTRRGDQECWKGEKMNTFGEDLLQSLNEALAHAKGEGPAVLHAPINSARGSETGEADASPDGTPHGHEPVRLPEMGARSSAGQWPGGNPSARDSERAGSRQARAVVFVTRRYAFRRIGRTSVPCRRGPSRPAAQPRANPDKTNTHGQKAISSCSK